MSQNVIILSIKLLEVVGGDLIILLGEGGGGDLKWLLQAVKV